MSHIEREQDTFYHPQIDAILTAEQTLEEHREYMPDDTSEELNEKLRKSFSLIDWLWIPQIAHNLKTKFVLYTTPELETIADTLLSGFTKHEEIAEKFTSLFGMNFKGTFTPGTDEVIR
jgi:hypothetical protein